MQDNSLTGVLISFRALFALYQREVSIVETSYSQANHLEIQYFTELIWNKLLTLDQKRMSSICF
jgi:hypothetical protein